ncbi:MAG: Gfo/Idh/MocA family oxidoreductase, partial [Blastocatellia bacterium]
MPETLADDYGLSRAHTAPRIAAPDLPYQPRNPKHSNPAIGVIGCGGIAVQHLNAYRHAGFRVVALCDHTEGKAREYQTRFYPDAFVTTDYHELLARDEIEVQEDRTFVAGTGGSIASIGPSLSEQTVTLYTEAGVAQPRLDGTWFREGFHGAMGELLSAIEEDRTPSNNARDNLRGLSLCFAAVASARSFG